MIRYLTALLLLSFSAVAETIDTGNILSNSTFGSGTTYDTTGWTISSGTSGHDNMNIAGGNDPGGSVATIGNTNIEQTVTLSEKTNMTVEEIQNGWSSTMSSDIWYWNQYNNTTTLKQTITGSDGSTSTQQRVIEDTGCGSINCGSYTNYTDTHIQGSNTQTDFDIKVGVSNSNNRTGHYGPDIDDVQLKIQYTYINPLEEDTQEIIDDINEDISDTIDDIVWEEEEYTWDDSWQDDYSWEEEYTWEEDFYFEEEFADFLEETGMEEEFMEFLEEEGITAEEFFEEVIEESFEEESDFVEPTEEAFDEEITDDNVEETTEVEAEEPETEEGSFEIASNEEETMEETPNNEDGELEEEDGQVSEEPNEESESDSETSDESDISSADEDEQEDVQPKEDREVEGGDLKGKVDIAKFENKLKKDIKKLVQEVKANTQNLSKEDIFFKSNNTLNAYLNTDFYKSKDIYTDQNLDLFNQIDLGVYNQDIYTTVSLASYVNNDPVEKHNKKLQEISIHKRQLQAELEALKNGKLSN